ncbi:hypothetical protein GLA29479_826 [Lysobacter antibioticus]|uniref:glycoside hydrolase family 75 protein n=1 Tax=Lysobacter antibioticus TaxID=84531 RepID=UPI000716FA30|nr:glycoside hydrolase family 75 protein [Lysobacter antibioticus]ALN61710.1 hypothetical protein GLA29479_826 [Lysobacter antibioticus]
MATHSHLFIKKLLVAAAVACGLLLVAGPARTAECGMSRSFVQPDGNARGGQTAVWSDPEGSALLFVEGLNVNTDGTRRSYSVDDFWGETRALNNLCNAMSDACAGLSSAGLKARRIATQQAAAAGWPAEPLRRTKISPAIIPFRDGKPCPAVDGFLVSATSLRKPGGGDACDIETYVDALVTPALVIPKSPSPFSSRAKVGDLAVAMKPGSDQPVFAVVGDSGPSRELGEASIALNGRLLGRSALPANYREVRGRGEFSGRGWTVPRAIVLIFPGTRDTANPFMTPQRIDETAQRRFEQWGGVARLQACAEAYSR